MPLRIKNFFFNVRKKVPKPRGGGAKAKRRTFFAASLMQNLFSWFCRGKNCPRKIMVNLGKSNIHNYPDYTTNPDYGIWITTDPECGSGFRIRKMLSMMGWKLTKVSHILMRTNFHATKSRITILHSDREHGYNKIYANDSSTFNKKRHWNLNNETQDSNLIYSVVQSDGNSLKLTLFERP